MQTPSKPATPTESGTIQSVHRAFIVLEMIAERGGHASVGQIAAGTSLPVGSVHRMLRSLLTAGYVRQLPTRDYALGPGLIRLGASAHSILGVWASTHLSAVVEQLGETANLATLDRDAVVYLAQVPSPHPMRMFTEVGRRVSAHSTGVGKALLSQLPEHEVLALIARTGLAAQTPRTITDPHSLLKELSRIRRTGYALDDAEQESGVRCIAVPIPDTPSPLAVSISGPVARLPSALVKVASQVLIETAHRLADALAQPVRLT